MLGTSVRLADPRIAFELLIFALSRCKRKPPPIGEGRPKISNVVYAVRKRRRAAPAKPRKPVPSRMKVDGSGVTVGARVSDAEIARTPVPSGWMSPTYVRFVARPPIPELGGQNRFSEHKAPPGISCD